MKAKVTRDGLIEIKAENFAEAYALKHIAEPAGTENRVKNIIIDCTILNSSTDDAILNSVTDDTAITDILRCGR